MDDHCPKCGNEIYKPYTYCNACGWEKSEKDEKSKKGKIGEKVSSKKKSPKKDKRMPSKERGIDKTLVPLKITCKCGGIIRIKSSKRPLKFQCPKCGRKGLLKDTKKVTKSTVDKHDKKPSKEPLEKSFDKRKSKLKMKKRQKGDIDKTSEFDDFEDEFEDKDFEEYGDEGFKGYEEEKFDDFRPKSRAKPVREERVKHRLDRDTEIRYKPSHGVSKKHKKIPKHKIPTSAYAKKQIKGVCSWCKSRNIRYFDDGSGRCSNCGKEFHWGGGPSRIQKKEYLCQRCKEPLEYIEEYDSWYCYSCKEYA